MAYHDYDIRTQRRPGLPERTIVAVEGVMADWAAYEANSFTLRHYQNSIASIIESGTKLYSEEGIKLFPDWAERLEWRA